MYLMSYNVFILEKLTEYGDEIKRLEDSVQQSRESGDDREKSLKREIEMKVGRYHYSVIWYREIDRVWW